MSDTEDASSSDLSLSGSINSSLASLACFSRPHLAPPPLDLPRPPTPRPPTPRLPVDTPGPPLDPSRRDARALTRLWE